MNFKELESVLTVEMTKSFSEAAYKTAYSTAAISKHVAKVERELGLQLFIRDKVHGTVRATAEGEIVFSYILKILNSYYQLSEYVMSVKGERDNFLSIGCVETIGSLGEDEIITTFYNKEPMVTVDRVKASGDALLQLLDMAKVDGFFVCCFGKLEQALQGLNDSHEVIPFYMNPECKIAVKDDDPMANNEFIDIIDFQDRVFAINGMQHTEAKQTRIFEQFCQDAGFTPKIRYTPYSYGMELLDMVHSGIVVSPTVTRVNFSYDGVKFLKVKDWKYENISYFVTKKGTHSKLLKSFISSVRKIQAKHIADGSLSEVAK